MIDECEIAVVLRVDEELGHVVDAVVMLWLHLKRQVGPRPAFNDSVGSQILVFAS